MSLLDDVSIVITPNGYKAGELYAVVPEPSEGSEEVTDGNFPSPNTSWSLSGWEILGNLAKNSVDGAGNNLYQGSVTSVNQLFKVVITATITAGSVKVMLGGGTGGYNEIGEATSTGTFTYYGTSFGTDNRILLQTGTGSVIGSVQLSNISVKEYTSADMDVTRATAGTRVDENGLVNYAEVLGSENIDLTTGSTTKPSNWGSITTNGISYLAQIGTVEYYDTGFTVTSGRTYKLSFTLSDYTGSDSLGFSTAGGVSTSARLDADGSYSEYFIASSTAELRLFGRDTNTGVFSNVSVKEVTRDNVPRIDYTGGGCPHILAEPMRTNLVTYSEAFSNWNTSSGVVVTDNTTELISPSGDYNASKIEYNGSNKNLFQAPTLSGVYSGYFYVKGTIGETIRMSVGGVEENFTLTGDWDKIKKENVTAIANTFNINTFGGATATTIYLWGGQVEQGSYATSYIPTSGSTVTRNQDIFTRDGIGSLINSTEGVLFLEMAALSDDGTNRYISINDGSTQNYVYFRFMSTSNRVLTRTVVAGVTINTLQITISDTTAFNKYAIKWKSGDYAFWINGVEVGTDSSSTIFSADVLNQIDFDFPTASGNFPSKVKQLQVYKTALTDAQLTSLTS